MLRLRSKGFDEKRVKKYITKYLGDSDKCEELLRITTKSPFIKYIYLNELVYSISSYDYGILCVPILLHMICVLFLRNVSLPETRTGIISAIVERCPDWEEIRKTGQKRVKAVEEALVKLGKFVLKKTIRRR